ncbi:2-dehydropantoate 2-reductase [Cytobacillus massiliigabonensis]|uniref:2-dehydropantoate 2-reductase n=1 Tax=Cytobacillus massiliigabonensis TaxID=1871011 RepID=UPI000C832B69|nr:2-dehydropantoate 2-reductase [Cytobacillus massiliigabonensis]
MKIGIIGGGSIGLLVAHYLMKQHEVHVYVRSKKQMDKLLKEGLIFEKEKKLINEAVNVSLFSGWNDVEELTIVTVKQYQLLDVIEKMKSSITSENGTILFLQNGMGHLKLLNELNDKTIAVGTVEHGANKIKENHIIHTGDGLINIALYQGMNESELAELLRVPIRNFPFDLQKDYNEMLVQKLIVNAIINPLTAVLNVNNGMLLKNPHYHYLFKEFFKEVSTILNIKDKEKTFRHLEGIARKTAANRSSMLKDLDEQRQTEIDAILGFVLEEARGKLLNAPFSENFYHLIKGKEYERGKN